MAGLPNHPFIPSKVIREGDWEHDPPTKSPPIQVGGYFLKTKLEGERNLEHRSFACCLSTQTQLSFQKE